MVVKPELCTRPDILHGGAVMAFADTLGAGRSLAAGLVPAHDDLHEVLAVADQQELAEHAPAERAAGDAEHDAAEGVWPVGAGRRHRRLLEAAQPDRGGLLANDTELVV